MFGPGALFFSFGKVKSYERCKKINNNYYYNIDRTLHLIGQKPMFYQIIKQRKSVFFIVFRPITAIS